MSRYIELEDWRDAYVTVELDERYVGGNLIDGPDEIEAVDRVDEVRPYDAAAEDWDDPLAGDQLAAWIAEHGDAAIEEAREVEAGYAEAAAEAAYYDRGYR